MPKVLEPHVFERDGKVFLVTPVAPFQPAPAQIEEFAYASSVKDLAPNPNILWLQGQYVEADRPNANGAQWRADDLAISSLTPNFMPITVMHDPRTAVGVIADTKLLTRDADNVPRSRIDNVLAVWKHRFPEVAEEAMANYTAGTLMQSMECLPQFYDCGECGKRFPKLPGGAEQANWCDHLKGEQAAQAARILGNVCFTGTGLIFGTRGAKGAFEDAHLSTFEDEVAEFHELAHKGKPTKRQTKRSKNTMELEDSKYETLVAKAGKVEGLESRVAELETEAAKVPDLVKKVEAAEIAQKGAETTRDEEKAKREKLEETANQATLSTERMGKLGAGFLEKLPDSVKTRLGEQAKDLKDEDWTARVEELAEMTGVKPDEAGARGSGGQTFTAEELAASRLGGNNGGGSGGGGTEPTPERRRSVVAGLAGLGSKK